MQNDRARGKVDWVGLNHIDEFFQFLGGENHSTLLDYLTVQKSKNVHTVHYFLPGRLVDKGELYVLVETLSLYWFGSR